MSGYASNTNVSEDRSRAEIERMVMRHGAEEFGYLRRKTEGRIVFVYQKLRIEMTVSFPARDTFAETATGRARTGAAATKEWEAEVRRRWRSLALVIKALLVGVDDNVLTFQQAFLAHIVMGDGHTMYQHALPHIQHAIETGQMPGSMKQLEALPAEQSKWLTTRSFSRPR